MHRHWRQPHAHAMLVLVLITLSTQYHLSPPQLWSVGRVAHPDMPEQKAAGEPVWAPSAISARGGKFRTLPGEPGYVQPTAVDDPKKLIAHYVRAAENAKKAGFDGVVSD